MPGILLVSRQALFCEGINALQHAVDSAVVVLCVVGEGTYRYRFSPLFS